MKRLLALLMTAMLVLTSLPVIADDSLKHVLDVESRLC